METVVATDLNFYEDNVRNLRPMGHRALNRVLIVEDDISLTNLLTKVLEGFSPNVEVDWATSGEEAEYYLRREGQHYGSSPYDLVIADIFLEGEVTGLDIWRLCEEKYRGCQTLVTSSMPIEKFVSCLKNEYACPAYLPKPFTMTECIEAIHEFI